VPGADRTRPVGAGTGAAMRQRLAIHGTFPGTNQMLVAAKSHWAVYAREKKRLTGKVKFLAQLARLQTVDAPVTVRFWWYEANARRDVDNISSGQKYVLDGLVAAGVLHDDRRTCVKGIEHHFPEPDPDCPRVEIELDTT